MRTVQPSIVIGSYIWDQDRVPRDEFQIRTAALNRVMDANGWKAVLISIEFTDDGFDPNYHSLRDKVSAMNLPYMVEVIRMTMAAVSDYAKIQG